MSFWNYLGGVVLFNMICDWFSGKPKSHHQSYTLLHDHVSDAEYETRIEELQREIEHSKAKIAEYQRIIDSESTYGIDDADVDELDDLYDDLADLEIDRDDDW